MKLPETKINVNTHGVLEEKTFGIHNTGMVLEILRSKLYADPIAAICREISCNARDANREIGRGDVPIKIILPTSLDPNYRIIDTGPGISPHRMETIFIQFAASTKRHSNEQTGGWGIGSKTPFAYVDQFTIVTIVDGIKRSYSAFIDPSKVGKLALLHEVATDQPNGTEIVIPVQPQHFQEFGNKTEAATRWWDVQPLIVGDFRTKRPNEDVVVMKGTDWKIYKSNQYRAYDSESHIILIDGIAYPIEASIVHDGFLSILFNGTKQFVVNFPNGLLSLAANRETVHWDQSTKTTVRSRLLEIANEIRQRLQSEIEKETDYVSAVVKARELTQAFNVNNGLNGYFSWRKTPVQATLGRSYNTLLTMLTVPRTPGQTISEATKVERSKLGAWEFGWDNCIVLNDIGIQNLSPKRAIQILNMLPHTYKSITLAPEKYLEAKEYEHVRKYVPFIKLSDVVERRDSKGKSRKARRLIFKKDGYGSFTLSSADEFEKTSGLKVYLLLTRGYDNKMSANVDELGYATSEVLEYISKKFNLRFFGFDKEQFFADPENYEDFTDEAVPFKEFIETVVLKDIDVDSLIKAHLGWSTYGNSSRERFLNSNVKDCLQILSKYVNKIHTQKEFKEYVDTYNTMYNRQKEWETISKLSNFAPIKDKIKTTLAPDLAFDKMKSLYSDICARYPLLKHSINNDHFINEVAIDMADYINMKDTK